MAHKIKNLKDYGFNTDKKVYVIAEIGINHEGSIETAKKLIDSASAAGVDAVKFQTYITEKRVDKSSPIFDILKKRELPFKAFKELKEYTSQYDVEFFSTPFDEDSLSCLEDINVGLYKIASFDILNHKLLNRIANTRKPVILSVGMANIDEIRAACDILSKGTDKISLLQCISAYPTKQEDANLAAIYSLREAFDYVIGQSDHTSDNKVALYAVAAGAQVIEKHYKISESMDCIDAPVSITQEQMSDLIQEIRKLETILGTGKVGMSHAQMGLSEYRKYRKS